MTDQLDSNDIVLLSHASTDISVLHQSQSKLPTNFVKIQALHLEALSTAGGVASLIEQHLGNAKIIVVRVLGRIAEVSGFEQLEKYARHQDCYLIVISGTGEPDPELALHSTVSPAILHEVTAYFQAGGLDNMAQMLRFLSDHLLMTGFGYALPLPLPEHGIYHSALLGITSIEDWEQLRNPKWPDVGIVFYRAHWVSGNLGFVDALIDALKRKEMNVLPVFTSSLRSLDETGKPLGLTFFEKNGASRISVLINTTSFAMVDVNTEGPTPSAWSVAAFEMLDIPVVQAITSSMTREQWKQSMRGLNPLDTAMNVALPEFDGRIIGVPISFKARVASDAPTDHAEYEPMANRVERIAGITARLAQLRHRPRSEKRIAFIFTNSNSKASQIGNAVGLDSPASLFAILHAMKVRGYRIENLPANSNQLIHDLIDRGTYDENYLTDDQLRNAVARVSASQYVAWFNELPDELRTKMQAQWGAPPGAAYVNEDQLMLAGLEYGNAFVALQPPRGYGMDQDAIYHTPDLPPTHHYYAMYRWLRDHWGADAIVHVGKHGTLEWLPGKGIGLSENCFPDALLGDMPLFYPFILNDPGEGAQSKRRAHAVVIDHLTPPMTTADTYGPLAQLTQLVDEYYQVEVLDPSKLPLLQQQIWNLIKETNLDSDLAAMRHQNHDFDEHDDNGHDHDDHDHDKHDHNYDHSWDGRLNEEGVPETLARMDGVDVAHLIEDIDGYLCELGAAQIRDGLHILGQTPKNEALIQMIFALVRLSNLAIPGLPDGIAKAFSLNIDLLLADKGRRLGSVPKPLQQLSERTLVTHADALDAISTLGNASRKKPLIRTVTSMRGRPNSSREITSTPMMR